METAIKNTTPLTVAPKKMKFLHIHFPKCVRDLYAENRNMLTNEIKAELIMDRITLFMDRRLSTVRPTLLLSKFIYRLNATPIKITVTV